MARHVWQWPHLAHYTAGVTGDAHNQRLASWKAIARFLGCSVRSARRWEQLEGLPVHRHQHSAGASVYAFADELAAWRESRREASPTRADSGVDELSHAPRTEIAIAVLPLSFAGADQRLSYLADGLTDEIISTLSLARAARVISRTSAMTLKGTSLDARSIAQRLAVSHIVEGMVRVKAGQLRIRISLIDAREDEPLWTRQYSGSVDDLFDIEEQIARRVLAALKLHIGSGRAGAADAGRGRSLTAWRYLQQARQLAVRWQPQTIGQAIELLEQGLAETGEHPDLLAALGRAWLQYRESGIDPGPRPLAMAAEYGRRASACDPAAPPVVQLNAWIAYARCDMADAIAGLEAAGRIEFNDPDTLSLLAYCRLLTGATAAALRPMERLLAIDPLTPLNHSLPGMYAAMTGDFEGAAVHYRRMCDMDGSNPVAALFLVWILAMAGRRDEALSRAEQLSASADAGDSPPLQAAALFAAALRGEPLEDPAPPLAQAATATEMFARMLFEAYACGGDRARAADCLRRAMDHGFSNYPYIAQHHPFFRAPWSDHGIDTLIQQLLARWQSLNPAAGRDRG